MKEAIRPRIASDIGTVLLGFSIYDLIYAPWHSRMIEFGLQGDEFGFIKGAVVAIICLAVCAIVIIDEVYYDAWAGSGFDHKFGKNDGADGVALFGILIVIAIVGFAYFAFGAQTAFLFFAGISMHELSAFVVGFINHSEEDNSGRLPPSGD